MSDPRGHEHEPDQAALDELMRAFADEPDDETPVEDIVIVEQELPEDATHDDVSPPEISLTDEFKAEIEGYSLDFNEVDHVEEAIADADVILVEPVVQPDYSKGRDDRDGDVGLTPANYRITRELLETKAKSDAILLHSLPRMDEIPSDVDITRWSRYWQEAFNGVVMRMALLALVMGKTE